MCFWPPRWLPPVAKPVLVEICGRTVESLDMYNHPGYITQRVQIPNYEGLRLQKP